MLRLLLLLILAGASLHIMANSGPVSLSEEQHLFDPAAAAAGDIDGQKYLAAIAYAGRLPDRIAPVVAVARVEKGNRYRPVAVTSIPNSSLGLSVRIANNSVYVRRDTAHRGIFFTTFQFKLLHGRFVLAGSESQSIATDYEPTACRKNPLEGPLPEIWSGESENLLGGRTIYWARLKSSSEDSRIHARRLFDAGMVPPHVVRQTVARAPRKLPSLEGFDFDAYGIKADYYFFDCALKFHKFTP